MDFHFKADGFRCKFRCNQSFELSNITSQIKVDDFKNKVISLLKKQNIKHDSGDNKGSDVNFDDCCVNSLCIYEGQRNLGAPMNFLDSDDNLTLDSWFEKRKNKMIWGKHNFENIISLSNGTKYTMKLELKWKKKPVTISDSKSTSTDFNFKIDGSYCKFRCNQSFELSNITSQIKVDDFKNKVISLLKKQNIKHDSGDNKGSDVNFDDCCVRSLCIYEGQKLLSAPMNFLDSDDNLTLDSWFEKRKNKMVWEKQNFENIISLSNNTKYTMKLELKWKEKPVTISDTKPTFTDFNFKIDGSYCEFRCNDLLKLSNITSQIKVDDFKNKIISLLKKQNIKHTDGDNKDSDVNFDDCYVHSLCIYEGQRNLGAPMNFLDSDDNLTLDSWFEKRKNKMIWGKHNFENIISLSNGTKYTMKLKLKWKKKPVD